MKIEEIRELKEMGFTADQIMQLSGQPETAPEESPEEAPAEETEPAEPEQTPAPDDSRFQKLEQTISEQQNQIRDLIKQMQANNRRTASMNMTPEQDLQKKTDEIMAELIRPSIKKGE